ncbi:MAG: DUF429 domain-containing protein [Candidatus Dormibacteria bacterium]
MITLGIDMASQPQRTAACRLQWKVGQVTILAITSGVTDLEFPALIQEPADKIGIDVPLGWPTAFVEAMSRHAIGQPFGTACPHDLAYRVTDRELGRKGQGWPLSVSADRIAYPAMRAARLLGALGAIDRSGQGRVVEVYPAAALRAWELPHRGYKGPTNRKTLEAILTALCAKTPWLALTADQRAQLTDDDNCADALLAALVAGAAAAHLCEPIPADHLEAAWREGWIAVPLSGSLPGLGTAAAEIDAGDGAVVVTAAPWDHPTDATTDLSPRPLG